MFFMSLDDFVFEYRALYVCRIFSRDIWKSYKSIQGEWVGKKAAGLPS